jgi:hypothetical protein
MILALQGCELALGVGQLRERPADGGEPDTGLADAGEATTPSGMGADATAMGAVATVDTTIGEEGDDARSIDMNAAGSDGNPGSASPPSAWRAGGNTTWPARSGSGLSTGRVRTARPARTASPSCRQTEESRVEDAPHAPPRRFFS